MSHSIQIYNGEGASNICVRAWKRELKDNVDGNRYKIEDFKQSYTAGFDRGNIAMIIIPGGNAIYMLNECRDLAGKINQAVAAQSSFLGSCAGAIVSASFAHFNCDKTAVDLHSDFNINPVPYSSRYYMPNSDSVLDPENRVAIEVDWLPSCGHFESRVCKLYHAYGPAFPLEAISSNTLPYCTSLAKYRTEGNTLKSPHCSAAIRYRPLGSSTPRLLTGIHPELGTEDIRSQAFAQVFDKPNHPHIGYLADMLEASEIVRKEMCRSWFAELGISLQVIHK